MGIWELWVNVAPFIGCLVTILVGQPYKGVDALQGGRWLFDLGFGLMGRCWKLSRIVLEPTRPGLCRIALVWYACCGAFIGIADGLPFELSAGGAAILLAWLFMMPTYLVVAKRKGWIWLLGKS